ncbi:MAG: helix-turn-helix domain-containing protein [Sphingobacterium sp.]|jgi:YesN/AraC family two-component response regulator|nr:helix-turn-helix domain-containing protein [Sphingobacterium sp.]
MKFIEKNLEEEANIKNSLTYIPLAGLSEEENFRSPDFYVFILFEKCIGTHFIDFVEYEEKDNQVHISFPGQIHSWKTGASARGHKLIVSKEFVEKYTPETKFSYLQINDHPVIDISPEECKKLSAEFKMLKKELASTAVEWNIVNLRAQVIITRINNYLNKYIRPLQQNRIHMLVNNFIDLIDTGFVENKMVSYYAKRLAVTPNYLNIITKRYLGISAKEVIDRRLILESKRLLLGSNFSIKEIADKLCFSSSITFAAYFSSKTGMYPKKYRDMEIVTENEQGVSK